jgi:hypothetical protein
MRIFQGYCPPLTVMIANKNYKLQTNDLRFN